MRDSGFRVSQCSAQKRVIGQVPVDFCYWIAGGRLSGRIAWRLRKVRLPWLVAEGSLARSASLLLPLAVYLTPQRARLEVVWWSGGLGRVEVD
jgi:hypothetical protein